MTWSAFKTRMTRRSARAIGVATAGVLGLALIGAGAACRANTEARTPDASSMTAAPAGAPMLVSCQAGEQALIRQTVVNGQPASEVECVPTATQAAPASAAIQSSGGMGTASAPPATAYQTPPPQAQPQVYGPSATSPGPPTAEAMPAGSVRPAVYEPAAQPAAEPSGVYDGDPDVGSSKRSWKKSAVIIGSSAAVGAGVGGATGGKKGALIGAALGGGGAAIWDAVTR